MINKINALPNYCNGKLYTRWDSVNKIFEGGAILASKTTKDNHTVQLLISDGGKKRELFFYNGKIMTISDNNSQKRTYIYENTGGGEIKGKYYHSTPQQNEKAPLIASAMWFLTKLSPKKLLVKINTENPASKIFIPSEYLKTKTDDFLGIGKRVTAQKILFKDFDYSNTKRLLPKTIVIKTEQGKTEVIKGPSAEYQKKLFEQLRLDSEELGSNIRTIV